MARIKIDDLPVAENLTPEQEEQIQGAGLRSFRPTLESLEGREMMDAGLGHGLQPPVLRPAVGGAGQVGHVRLLDSPAPGATQAPRAALPQANLHRGGGRSTISCTRSSRTRSTSGCRPRTWSRSTCSIRKSLQHVRVVINP